jgi:hypothetical protein
MRAPNVFVQQLNLLDMVDVVVCGDDIDTQPKPHPHNALLICSQLGIDPKEAYMVGDTLADVKMGRSAQLRGSIGVLSGVSSASDLGTYLLVCVQFQYAYVQLPTPIISSNMLVIFFRTSRTYQRRLRRRRRQNSKKIRRIHRLSIIVINHTRL